MSPARGTTRSGGSATPLVVNSAVTMAGPPLTVYSTATRRDCASCEQETTETDGTAQTLAQATTTARKRIMFFIMGISSYLARAGQQNRKPNRSNHEFSSEPRERAAARLAVAE